MKYISVVETAKLIRKSLKQSFPGAKFSVRSSSYSGGASIDISYEDGPKEDDVEAVVNNYKGAYFDGMIDYKGSVYGSLDGEEVRFGADFIFVKREYSDEMIEEAIELLVAEYPQNFKENGLAWKPLVKAFRMGKYYNLFPCGGDNGSYNSPYNLQSMIYGKLGEMDNGYEIQKSDELKRVAVLGSDGYSCSQTAMAIGAAPGRGM